MPDQAFGKSLPVTKRVWFTGFNYDPTGANRAALGETTLKVGEWLAYDFELFIDQRKTTPEVPAALGIDVVPKSGPLAYATRPSTATLEAPAGVIVGFPQTTSRTKTLASGEGCWVDIAVTGQVQAIVDGNSSNIALHDHLTLANGEYNAVVSTGAAANAAALQATLNSTVARALEAATTDDATIWVELLLRVDRAP